ncbi:HNH endonuclease signature motif containing protein [Phycicoccus duodecadis]|uniref:HNH endonuclease n=1 Tax=Phycicoccus duodecadis TaxID=173053 RepID=A0A2N3YFT5_9MICO|nr:HNH endonuclease signature motif containing protein [Phycicoccus duodecadis]PKW25711.1 HNH endonuclease [Phycicoccus duodecadis]
MDQLAVSLEERRSSLVAAGGALAGMADVLHQASGDELAELLTIVDDVAAQSAAARVAITAEALNRGEVAAAGTNAHTWVRDHAPSLRQGGAGQVATVAMAVTGGGAGWQPDRPAPEPDSPLGLVAAGVADGSVSPALATAVLREVERLAPHLRDEALPTVVRALIDLGVQWGPTVMRRLRPRLLAEYGLPGELDDLQERLAGSARLSMPLVESGDLTEYQLLMTPEQATALEAAIGPLSAPAPDDETGQRDLRPAGQRRVEALTEVCRRSSALDAEGKGADGAAAASSAVHVTIALNDLVSVTGCGEVLSSSATATVLSPQVLRRISCEADLIPHVLGTAGEELDLGRVVRLFTRAQRRLLRRRDRGCTFPGCTAPAAWTKAHHIVHWADGGASDVDNAGLLCQRHHTYVHTRRLIATVSPRPDHLGRYVAWDLEPGSYDRHLEKLRAERAVHDPPPLTPERLRLLLDGLWVDDPAEQAWAESELGWMTSDDPWPDDEEPTGSPPATGARLLDRSA